MFIDNFTFDRVWGFRNVDICNAKVCTADILCFCIRNVVFYVVYLAQSRATAKSNMVGSVGECGRFNDFYVV